MFRQHCVGDMTAVHNDVISVADTQFDVANLRVGAGEPHLEPVSGNVVDIGIARKFFDQNELEIAVDQPTGIFKLEHDSMVSYDAPGRRLY